MFSLVVLFTVFLGLVGVLIFLNELQKKWSTARTMAPLLLRERIERWLCSHRLHAPTPAELIPVLNERLASWLNANHTEHKQLKIVELLPGTKLPEIKVNKITSHTSTSLTLDCDVEWPMCVPGVAVRVVPVDALTPTICHLQVEWMYAHARVVLEQGDDVLLFSYANTSPPMMGVSCGVEHQSLDDQESAKLASSVADVVQGMFSELVLKRVPLVTVQVPLVLVSAPEEGVVYTCNSEGVVAVTGVPCDGVEGVKSEPGDDDGKSDGVLGVGSGAGNSVKARESENEQASEQSEDSVPREVGGAPTEVGGAGENDDRNEDSHPLITIEQTSDPAHESPLATRKPLPRQPVEPLGIVTPPEVEGQSESLGEPRPLSPQWRRSSSYEQLTNSLTDTPPRVTDHLMSPDRQKKALTMSMAGSEAESLYGADDRIPSTLVFELKDSNRVRHIVALSGPHANKLRRHFGYAQKLHIYNDHCFVATHLKEKILCEVCKHKISGIFGKQAYTCRDCGLTLHKQCHFRTESLCPHSKIQTMNLIYPTNVSTVSS